MPKCALPDHLKDKKHTDWIWPLNKLPRSINAYGPRCEVGTKGYRHWPPILIKGLGVARWETVGATSIVEIPELANKFVTRKTLYGNPWECIERREGHPDFGLRKVIYLKTDGIYSPSALQRFSKRGHMELSPHYTAKWRLLKEMEGENYYAFFRWGYRPDHVDWYYNWGPMLGLKMD